MKIIVIGAVAAGTSAAAKARRNREDAEIVVYEQGQDISYSGCGLPYFIGGKLKSLDQLVPRDAAFFKKKYNLDIKIEHRVERVTPDKKEVEVKNLQTGEVFKDSYDKLVIATGAHPYIPKIEGIEQNNVFSLRSVKDALEIHGFIKNKNPRRAMIVGTGFIGLELLENLLQLDVDVTMVEMEDKITPNLDKDVADYLENLLEERKVRIIKSAGLISIKGEQAELSNGMKIEANMIIMTTGVRPNVSLAKDAGIELGSTGAIKVNNQLETNIKGIYACGDCIETFSTITGKKVYRPLGSTANKTGRIAGDNVTGGKEEYKGNLSTGIFKVCDIEVGSTGLSEKEAISEGFNIQTSHDIKPDKVDSFGGKDLLIKAIADKETGRLLGAQVVGYDGVDKRIDVFATLITYKATVDEIFNIDLSYSPPFATAKDPIHYTGMILDNAINKERKLINYDQLSELKEEAKIIDVRSEEDFKRENIAGAENIPHENLRSKLGNLSKGDLIVAYCDKGVAGNAAQNILMAYGFKKVFNFSGGHEFYRSCSGKAKCDL